MFKYLLQFLLLTLILSNTACTQFFFFPYKNYAGTPSDLGYSFDDIYLNSADGTRLHGWLVKAGKQPKGTIYFLHGNAENISTHIHSVLWLVKQGYDVFALDYRGFGKSEGKPKLPEVFDDIDAGAKWVLGHSAKRPNKKPVLFGQSIGASLAITYLGKNPGIRSRFGGLISEGAFSSYDTIARHALAGSWITWPLRYPVSWILPNNYDPIDAAPNLAPLPVMIVHSTEDKVIPFIESQKLSEQLSEPKTLMRADGPHIQAVKNPETRRKILSFIESL